MLPACPTPESLAAFMDGHASPEERARLLEHLRGCEDCYAVVVATARMKDERSAPQAGARPRPIHLTWLPLAAAAALAVGLGWWFARQPEPPATVVRMAPSVAPSVPLTSARLAEAAPAWLSDAPWDSAGAGRRAFSAQQQREPFLIGLHLGALDRACRAGEPARGEILAAVRASLERAGLLHSEEQRSLVTAGCPGEWPADGGHAAWIRLGRTLERWRIEAAEHAPAALEPERSRQVVGLVAQLPVPAPARRAAAKLKQPRRETGAAAWDGLQADILDLIELLCD